MLRFTDIQATRTTIAIRALPTPICGVQSDTLAGEHLKIILRKYVRYLFKMEYT